MLADMWRQLAARASAAAPAARSSHSVTAIGNRVYVFSGEKEPRVPVGNDLHCYDLDRGSWTVCSTAGGAPGARVGHAAAAVGSQVYVFGGRTEVEMGEGLLDDLYCYDTVSATWSLVDAGGDKPCGRSYHAMVSDGHHIYLFGGCTKGRLNDLYSFDPVSRQWVKLPTHDAIKPRGGPGLAVVGHHIYVVAGFTGDETDDMHRFDTQSSTWETLNPRPNIPPISVFGMTTLQKSIIMFGGEVKPSTEGHAGAGGFSNEVYQYHTDRPENGWQKLAISGENPSPRGWLPATTTADGEVVIFGGLSPANERLCDLWALKP